MQEIKVTNNSVLNVPERSDMFCVENKDWERLKNLINKLSLKATFWENFIWFCLPTTISTFLSYFALDPNNKFKIVFLIVGFCFLFATLLLIAVNKALSKNTVEQKEYIIEEMRHMEIAGKNAQEQAN